MTGPIFFQVVVMDNQDPMMLGRIRARLLTDNYNDIVKSITDPPWDEQKDIWTSRDPFIFNPLMPYFMYQVPKVEELAQVIYVNKDFKYQNQYYVQNTFSSPTTILFEYYQGANKFTGTGTQLSNPKPLKNQDGTYADKATHKGVFPEPGDNAILGRGSADLIVKENEVLLRAGKFKSATLQPNVIPSGNSQRGFLQLSRVNTTKVKQEDKTIVEFNEKVIAVKYLVEWVIINPENTQNKFSGNVYLYGLKPDISTNSKNLTVGSVVDEKLKSLIESVPFTSLSITDTAKFINNFINKCNGTPSVTDPLTGSELSPTLENNLSLRLNGSFPFFYRPNNLTYSYLKPSLSSSYLNPTGVEVQNIQNIFNNVKLFSALKQGGYGLVYAKSKVGIPLETKTSLIPNSTFVNSPTTYGALGSDNVFLLSHQSSIPGKGKINFDNTLYGITGDQFVDEIIPKTSSLVRGEELMELINLIVRFLVTHTHAFPGLPPVPVTQDGSNVQDILTELQNATNKILNKNIRLN
jgi:hypothetical protein